MTFIYFYELTPLKFNEMDTFKMMGTGKRISGFKDGYLGVSIC